MPPSRGSRQFFNFFGYRAAKIHARHRFYQWPSVLAADENVYSPALNLSTAD